ncbi:MAG TPA: cysteine peptidase family C39 domain-containing protein [Polyangiaceae bacterium]|nr:cysteine peptidase family C39 domain-containing protein [Polyangiaceae bacterium]
MSWRAFSKKVRPLQQMEAAECGVACLAMVLDYHGASIPLHELRDHCGTSRDGNSALQLLQVGQALGLRGRGLKLDLEGLQKAKLPLILHWQFNHFVVLEGFSRGRALIVDPASGRIQADREQLDRAFSGIALQFDATPGLERRRRRSEGVAQYFQNLKGHRSAIAYVMLAGACAQVLAIVAPSLQQVLVDHVIQPVRREWLLPVMALMIVATVAGLALQWLYQLTIASLQTVLRAKLTNQMARRLLRLPLEFVESRSRGDLMQRVSSYASLGPLLTQTMLGIFQAAFISVLAVLMLCYDLRLALLSLGIDLLRMVVVRVTREDARQRSAGELVARGRESSVVHQATSSAEMVKAFGLETRLEQWYARRLGERLEWTRKAAHLHSGAASWLSIFDAGARAAVLWFGGMKVIHFQMPIGVFVGFLAIRGLLGGPLASLWNTVESWLQFRSVLARSDEVLAQPTVTQGTRSADGLRGRLSLRNVGFRYSNGAPWVLRGVSMDIEPGDHVAIIGPSGQGKSTLLEILAGVLDPSEGEVLLDGVPVRQLEERSLARKFGTVVGTPLVIAGTIRENLVLRLPEAEDAEVLEAARAACFAEVVARTADGFETCLESEGTNLSGGERQRLGLAQAFLGRPSVLFLDEATCFLDAPTEKRVIDNFLRAGVTVVSVAHRPAVIEASRQVFLVRDGRVSAVRGASAVPAPNRMPPPRVRLRAAHERSAAAL